MSGLIGGGSSPTNAPISYSGLNVSTSQWNMPLPLCWGTVRLSTNAFDYKNFQQHSQSAKGGGKGGGGKGSGQYTYSADVLLGLCEGPVDSIQNIWANGSTTTTTTLSALGMQFFNGTQSQSPWSYWASNYSGALAYAQTAYLGAANLNLGDSATIPDNGFEIIRTNGFAYTRSSTVAGWINPATHAQASATDVLLSDCTADWLINPQYGTLMPAASIGSMTQWATYMRALGLFVSPLLNSQEKGTDVLNRWAQISNSWIYDSGVEIMFVPLGDQALTGNGVTFAPQNDVAYTLQLADLVCAKGEAPVKVTRKDAADCYNRTTVSITDRTLGYISNPIQWYDDNLIDLYGLRDNTSISADEIKDPAVGAIIAQLIGKRAAYIRNTYQFKPTPRFLLVVPGTVLSIPLNYTGVSVRVRVTEVGEDENGQLTMSAEEFPGTVGTYIPAQAQAVAYTSTFPNTNAAPPAVNTPGIIEPPAAVTGGVAKIIVAASGSTNWGGCYVWLSFDGLNYRNIGAITTPAVQGVLTAALPAFAGTNPDTVDTLAINTAQSGATPQPVTNSDAQMLRTLSLITAQPTSSGGILTVPGNGELLAFGAVAATGTNAANLTYLERGQYGTAPGSHNIGDQFTLIDLLGTSGSSVEFALPPAYIGQTLYFKLASFNQFGNAVQPLSACAEYQYSPLGTGYGSGGSGLPSLPTGIFLAATPTGANVIAWNANPAGDGVTQYTLLRCSGASPTYAAATIVYQGNSLSFTDTIITANSVYTYYLVASNAVGNSPPTAGVSLTATTGSSVSTGSTSTNVTGTIDGTNKVFTLPSAVPTGQAALVLVNGVNVSSASSISGTTLTLTTAPASGSSVNVTFYVVSSGGAGGGSINRAHTVSP